jgi:protein-tyrosine phosphatase
MVEPFAIHEVTLTNGGRIGITRMPGRGGDLAGDVARIAAWPAAFVVSMTEMDEMAARGVAGLGEALANAGIAWRHFPIRDFGAPDGFETRWPALSAELHAALDQGRRILVHCAGGCGRSGMVAMRLLCERGMEPEAALVQVRAARPCAVEQEAQRAWAAAGFGG